MNALGVPPLQEDSHFAYSTQKLVSSILNRSGNYNEEAYKPIDNPCVIRH